MKFKTQDYLSTSELLNGILNGSILPKSESLILSLSLRLDNSYTRKLYCDIFNNYSEFLPISLFSGEMREHSSSLLVKILNYNSKRDDKLANLFNQIVMLLCYSEKYVNVEKWNKYFSGYDNKGISEQEKYKLLEFTINDICDLIQVPRITIATYTYGVDGVMKSYYDTIPFNEKLRKFYIEDVLGTNYTHEEEKARDIIFYCTGRCLLELAKKDSSIRDLLGISLSRISEYTTNQSEYFNDINNISKALSYYYKIYTGYIKFQY
ncbi:MAG: hypothetical protein IJX17_05220 [Clostridia bacterium]|nr:hypothetical protein [Clostridia bacterium]